MAITAADVKALRDRTGLAMMKCKKALTETDGDIDAAVELLRKQGLATADKKAGRDTNAGSLGIALGDGNAAVVLLACETDFVSANDEYKSFVTSLAEAALAGGYGDVESLAAGNFADGSTISEGLVAKVQKLGENMKIAEVKIIEADKVVGYNHGGRVAALVGGNGDEAILRKVAMHVAASNPEPVALSKEDVAPELLAKEREIIAALPEVASKPEAIQPKIIDGKMGRFFKEQVLLEQEMLVDNEDGSTVSAYVKAKGSEVTAFVRLAI
jgi:elongation factor Ts